MVLFSWVSSPALVSEYLTADLPLLCYSRHYGVIRPSMYLASSCVGFFFFLLFCSVILAVILSVFQLPAWSQHAKPVAKTCCLRFRLLPCGVLRTLLSGRSLLLQRKALACNSPGCSPSTVTLWNPTCLPVAPLDHMFKFQTSRHSKSDHNYCKILS